MAIETMIKKEDEKTVNAIHELLEGLDEETLKNIKILVAGYAAGCAFAKKTA